MDEPCSALDPIATAKVEELIHQLKRNYTIVIVTHNMQQAGRCSDHTAFFYLGRLIEFGATSKIFSNPGQKTDRGLHHRPIRLIRSHDRSQTYPRNLRRSARLPAQQRPDDGEPGRAQSRSRDQRLARSATTNFARTPSPTTKRSISSKNRSTRMESILLLRFQPVASDLRRVVSAMKLSSNLERMADQAMNIARKARKLNQASGVAGNGIDQSDAGARDGDVQGQRRCLRARRCATRRAPLSRATKSSMK